MPSLDDCHPQRTHDRFLSSGFGLHTYYAKEQKEEREKHARRIELINKSKAMAIARLSIHLKIDTGYPDSAFRAWHHENVEDFAEPAHIPLVYDKKKSGRCLQRVK